MDYFLHEEQLVARMFGSQSRYSLRVSLGITIPEDNLEFMLGGKQIEKNTTLEQSSISYISCHIVVICYLIWENIIGSYTYQSA